jgi:hypothetical protein
MRFEVPQFIEVEDKIVGPLTWRQFIYLAGGIGILVVFYFLLPFILFAILGLPLAALAGFLAFHRVNNRPFSVFLESFFNYMRRGKLYLWRKEHTQVITSYRESGDSKASPIEGGQKRLATLAQKLEFYSLEK